MARSCSWPFVIAALPLLGWCDAHRLPPLRARVARMTARPSAENTRWETARSGTFTFPPSIATGTDMLGNATNVPLASAAVPPRRFEALHHFEYKALRAIQKLPGLLPFSLAVHYSLLPKVITPLLALIVWLNSLPRGASLITFVCANDCLNTALKWAVQRPRPRWYCPDEADGLMNSCGAWEVDLSFPSAHTMFFAGLASCAATLYGWPLAAAAVFGALIGLTRNFLSMHWPTDTAAGLVLGGLLGAAWGRLDPYAALLAAGSPLISLAAASYFTLGLLCLMVASRQLVAPVAAAERATWFANALQSLDPDERARVIGDPRLQLKPRNLKSKVPMLTTVWCALAITGLYPHCLPSALNEPAGSIARRLAQTLIGLVGLGGVSLLKLSVGKSVSRRVPTGKRRDTVKGLFKALTYVALCSWTFLLSQRAAALVFAVLRV